MGEAWTIQTPYYRPDGDGISLYMSVGDDKNIRIFDHGELLNWLASRGIDVEPNVIVKLLPGGVVLDHDVLVADCDLALVGWTLMGMARAIRHISHELGALTIDKQAAGGGGEDEGDG